MSSRRVLVVLTVGALTSLSAAPGSAQNTPIADPPGSAHRERKPGGGQDEGR